MKKKIYYLILLLFFLTGASFLMIEAKAQLSQNNNVPLVLGDDDEDEEDEDEDEEDEDEDEEDEKTVTTYVKLPDQIIKKLIEIVTFDSDGDGVFDPDDSTPNLHNIFLVKDDNWNGIVDAYENRE